MMGKNSTSIIYCKFCEAMVADGVATLMAIRKVLKPDQVFRPVRHFHPH
jgi:hypothetical protein